MKDKYEILAVVYTIVRERPQPLQYLVSTRELLLRLKGDWQPEYLEELARDGLVIVVRDSMGVMVRLTEKGWEKVRMKMAFRIKFD